VPAQIDSPILVTGGSGFIGTNLVRRLLALGEQVVNLDSSAPRDPEHGHLWRNLMTEMLHDVEPLRGLVPDLPVPLEEGVARTVRWLRDRGHLKREGAA